ncbi:MAG TPA: hypothetical protein VF755_29875 [Catenuloplanes sp.]
MTSIEPGDVLWIYPDQWLRAGSADGFPYRVVDLLGQDGQHPHDLWVRGMALDRETGVPVQEIVLKVPRDQQRARQGRIITDPPAPPPAKREPIRPAVQVCAGQFKRTI